MTSELQSCADDGLDKIAPGRRRSLEEQVCSKFFASLSRRVLLVLLNRRTAEASRFQRATCTAARF